jgi:hypothetical protein
MTRNYRILTSYWFIVGLTILLFNDFVLKGLYGNWFTGKLSDFSGLFVFALFWTALYPKHKTKIFWLTGILFVFWKSTYSQPLIDFWNDNVILTIYRTVDYSDLIALTVLPIANYVDLYIDRLKTFKLNPIYPVIVSAFAFMATSYRTDVNINKDYHLPFPKDTLINRINKIDSLNYGYGVKFTDNNPDTVDFSLPSTFCFTNFDVKIAVTEQNSNTTKLTLISAEHRCPEGKKDKEELTKEFEKKIIDKIKNGL